jgi:hypothetical protein
MGCEFSGVFSKCKGRRRMGSDGIREMQKSVRRVKRCLPIPGCEGKGKRKEKGKGKGKRKEKGKVVNAFSFFNNTWHIRKVITLFRFIIVLCGIDSISWNIFKYSPH